MDRQNPGARPVKQATTLVGWATLKVGDADGLVMTQLATLGQMDGKHESTGGATASDRGSGPRHQMRLKPAVIPRWCGPRVRMKGGFGTAEQASWRVGCGAGGSVSSRYGLYERGIRCLMII